MLPIGPRLKFLIDKNRLFKKLREITGDTAFPPLDWFIFIRKPPLLSEKIKSSSDQPEKLLKEWTERFSTKVTEEPPSKKTYGIDLQKILDDIKQRVMKGAPQEKPVPKWKSKPPKITQEGINQRTDHLLLQIMQASEVPTKLKRLEELLQHFLKHPSAKPHATHQGAIRLMLLLRREITDEVTQQAIRQNLAVLGHVDAPKSSGIRILSIDGGGMRGLSVVKMLKRIESLTGKKVTELFDYMCGVSTGAIIICCMLPPNSMTMDQIYLLYRNLSTDVFNQNAFLGTSKLLWSHAYYDTVLWENLLKSYVGNTAMLESVKYQPCPKVATVSTIVKRSKSAAFLFRNYENPSSRGSEYMGSCKHSMFEAVRASSAAPTIFEEFKIDGIVHQDGGLVVNNPTAIAIHEAKTLWPNERISCIVSCGTGRHNPITTMEDIKEMSQGSNSWKAIFEQILASATDTEGVHVILNDLIPEEVYFRLNPHLSQNVTMDEIKQENINSLEKDTELYCRRNEDKFNRLVTKLKAPRSKHQLISDQFMLAGKYIGAF